MHEPLIRLLDLLILLKIHHKLFGWKSGQTQKRPWLTIKTCYPSSTSQSGHWGNKFPLIHFGIVAFNTIQWWIAIISTYHIYFISQYSCSYSTSTNIHWTNFLPAKKNEKYNDSSFKCKNLLLGSVFFIIYLLRFTYLFNWK